MNIYLSGMIGSGKTTLGRALAVRLGWPFEDLDVAMHRMAGKSFRRVVAEDGWLRFRELEYALCKRFAALNQAVIGLGVNVLLTARLETLAGRVRSHDRPRVHQDTTLEQDLAAIWTRHRQLYLDAADVVYDTDQGKTVAQEVEDLLGLLEPWV
jgi:shikimate kinase